MAKNYTKETVLAAIANSAGVMEYVAPKILREERKKGVK